MIMEEKEKPSFVGPAIFTAVLIGTLVFFYWFLISAGGGGTGH